MPKFICFSKSFCFPSLSGSKIMRVESECLQKCELVGLMFVSYVKKSEIQARKD